MISGIDIEDMRDAEVVRISAVLTDKEIPFTYSEAAHMFKLYNEDKERTYQYFYTTGKWGVYRVSGYPKKHYNSKSIEDFLNRFFYKTDYENKSL
tara:strand:+ start:33 stop:317 length:285 start_codon:yes stop_codon:yes gene_type:complete